MPHYHMSRGDEREVHKRDETGQSNTFIDNTFLSLSYLVFTFGLKKKKPFVDKKKQPCKTALCVRERERDALVSERTVRSKALATK